MNNIEIRSMKISPRYTTKDWNELQVQLEGAIDCSNEVAWQKAIDIFEDRIRGRFLDQISRIEDYTFAGFAVLALDCLLIETLEQFRRGVKESKRGGTILSKCFFVSFLTGTSFRKDFTPETACIFYYDIRCGILHQAETKNSTIIVIKQCEPLVRYSDDGKGLVINRKKFHRQLVQEFENYIAELRNPSNQGPRMNFKKKMNYICEAGDTENV